MSRKLSALLIGTLAAALAAVAPALAAGAGAVYTMTNAVGGNSVVVFSRSAQGALLPAGSFPTGGFGTGGGLGNQGALALTHGERFLIAVNPGSDDISVFAVDGNGLRLTDREASGGRVPISVTTDRGLVYVLNAGGSVGAEDRIAGFKLGESGDLEEIPGSSRPLSGTSVGPAQVAFAPGGDYLVVTEKDTNTIDLFSIDAGGAAAGPIPFPAAGVTPFGVSFDRRGRFFVAEASGSAPGAATLSSYDITAAGGIETLAGRAPNGQTAACWAVVTGDGRYAYTTNTPSGTLSGFLVGADGSLTLLDPDGVTAETGDGSGPIDLAFDRASRFVYVLAGGAGAIQSFRIGPTGGLQAISTTYGLPPGANGLAAR